MKKLLALLFIFFLSLVQAQKVIEKNISYDNQYIDLDVKFASKIEVKTWEKSTIYFKANIYTKESKYLDLYEVDIKEDNSTISIESDTETILKKFWEGRKKTIQVKKDIIITQKIGMNLIIPYMFLKMQDLK